MSDEREPDGWIVSWKNAGEEWAPYHDVAPRTSEDNARRLAAEFEQMGHDVRVRPFRFLEPRATDAGTDRRQHREPSDG